MVQCFEEKSIYLLKIVQPQRLHFLSFYQIIKMENVWVILGISDFKLVYWMLLFAPYNLNVGLQTLPLYLLLSFI